MRKKIQLMDELAVKRALTRLSFEIVEKNENIDNVVLVGIKTRGIPMAKILQSNIEKNTGVCLPLCELDITFYRDDLSLLSSHPIVHGTTIPFDVNGKKIVLVDDVLFTGRTIRSAIEAIFDYGRPQQIQLAILIDRGHRQLPFRPDFVGKNVPTALSEQIKVKFEEFDEENQVLLCEEA